MNTKNQKAKNKKLPTILIAVGLLLAVSATLGFVFQDKIKAVTADIVANIENSNKPKFAFDNAKLSDWASSGNTHQSSDPITTISATQCTEGSNCSNLVEKCRVQVDKSNQSCQKLEQYTAKGCMVHAYYSSGSVNPEIAVKDQMKAWSGYGGGFSLTPTEVGVKTLTMTTPEGDKEYQLHQYDTNNKDDTYKKGTALGFISLSDGHIEVRATCWKASQLDDTLPVLSAMRLEA